MKTRTNLLTITILIIMVAFSCKKKDNDPPADNTKKAAVKMNITDARCANGQKGTFKTGGGIIDPVKLTKFEVSFSGVYLKDASDNLVNISSSPFTIDLRLFRGTIKELIPVQIPVGSYKSIVLK